MILSPWNKVEAGYFVRFPIGKPDFIINNEQYKLKMLISGKGTWRPEMFYSEAIMQIPVSGFVKHSLFYHDSLEEAQLSIDNMISSLADVKFLNQDQYNILRSLL